MKAIFCDGVSARLRTDLPEPTPAPGEVLLKVLRAGICDTDLQLARGYMGFRGILGHEFLAFDDQGRRVTAEINQACRACPTCAAGQFGHCPHRVVLGIWGHDGAMAPWIAVDPRTVHRVPDAIDDRRAIFIEPLAAAFRILEQTRVDSHDRVAVLGDGKLGLLCAWVLRSTGARVTLVGKHAAKLALAGPEIESRFKEEVESQVQTAGGSDRARFDLVVDATGSASGLPLALKLVRPLGRIVLKTTLAAETSLAMAGIVIDEVTVIGSRCGPFPRAIEALARGEIDPVGLLGPEFPLERGEEAFAAAARPGAGKVVLMIS
jgi:alcohol dehydrogenase